MWQLEKEELAKFRIEKFEKVWDAKAQKYTLILNLNLDFEIKFTNLLVLVNRVVLNIILYFRYHGLTRIRIGGIINYSLTIGIQ